MPPHNIVVRGVNGEQTKLIWGMVYKEVAVLTERVITALQTDKAISVFSELSEKWKLEHDVEFDVEESVGAFQDLLENAITQPNLWPTITVDLGMSDDIFGRFLPQKNAKTFRIEGQHIFLNGLRVFLLWDDRKARNPEWYPRWFEMFITYCHEMAHLYVAYLSLRHKGGTTCRTPLACSIDFYPTDSGHFLEKHLFGGNLERGRDTSRREPKHMPGVPVFQVDGFGFRGIPLQKILDIANRAPGEPYTSSDFELDLYRPRELPLSNQEDPENTEDPAKNCGNSLSLITLFGRWWEEYKAQFGVEFAKPGGTYRLRLNYCWEDECWENIWISREALGLR